MYTYVYMTFNIIIVLHQMVNSDYSQKKRKKYSNDQSIKITILRSIYMRILLVLI